MAESEQSRPKMSEPMTFTVVRASNLKGQKGETVNALVKVEFADKHLGETPKVECSPGKPAEFNFHSTINVSAEDPFTLDELACRPVLCTVIEVLPKEKKQQKEEKTVTLGQCTVDLLPMLQGELKCRCTLPILSLPGSPIDNLAPDHPRPELDVVLSVNEAILSEQKLKESNMMSITLESLYSPPESWSLGGPQYMYTASMPVPINSERENPVVFVGGQLKPGGDKEVPNKQKKWAIPGNAQGNAVYIPDQFLSADAMEDEDGDYKKKEDKDHRVSAEQDKVRTTWNIERRCYMDNTATTSLQEKIAKMRYWPIEVTRSPLPAGGKGKGKDDDAMSFHGVAYLNLAPLLYPGVKRIRGAYKVVGFNEHDLQDKTGRRGSMAEEALRIAQGILNRSTGSPSTKPAAAKKEEGKGKEPKKGTSTVKASDSASEAEVPAVNQEGQQYTEAKSYFMVEINLHQPLVPKKKPEELAKNVAEYIPPRPMYPRRTDGAERAVSDFQNQVGVVANLILDEFREKFGSDGDNPASTDERIQELMYHLNSTGKYCAFKEQLKHSVVKIVREKYLKKTSFTDKDQLQTFLSELYVYIVDQMHVGLGKVLAIEDQIPVPAPLTDAAQLKHFAREAEVNENFDLAAKYYQERIAREKNSPDHWLDYGTFCLYINDLTKAEECFKECVSIDQRHEHGLLLNGVVCTMQDKHEAAETFFMAATTFYPHSIQAWTMLGLFYDGIGNDIGTEMALAEANKLNMASAAQSSDTQDSEEKPSTEEDEVEAGAEKTESGETVPEKKESGSDKSVEKKDSGNESDKLVEALSKESFTEGVEANGPPQSKIPSTPSSLNSSEVGKSRSHKNLEHRGSAQGRTKSGKVRSSESRPISITKSGMVVHDDAPPSREPTPLPTSSIFMQVVHFLLEVKAMPFTERALAHHLVDVLGGPSSEYHICLAQLRLQKHQMEEAEQVLQGALQSDHQNPDVWALMGHVKYLLGDCDAARHCYERTLAFVNCASEMHSIYLRLASIYLQLSMFQEAKNSFLLACKKSPSCVSWLGVGIACYRLGELSEAEDALCEANSLNNTDPEVWAYLALVCLSSGRKLEAEQAYKFTVKLDIQDEDLLNEIHQLQEQVGFGNPQL